MSARRPPVLQASPALTGCKAITGAYDILNHLRDALSGAFVCRPAEADQRKDNLKTVCLEKLPEPVCVSLLALSVFSYKQAPVSCASRLYRVFPSRIDPLGLT
jgi:hypothetical protein